MNFERTRAGEVATLFFRVEAWVAAVLGVAYVLLRSRFGPPLERRALWIALITIAAPLTFYVVLRPLMDAARAAGDGARVNMLHSTSSVLFLTACLGALLLGGWDEIPGYGTGAGLQASGRMTLGLFLRAR